jgi:hypothetical protein
MNKRNIKTRSKAEQERRDEIISRVLTTEMAKIFGPITIKHKSGEEKSSL